MNKRTHLPLARSNKCTILSSRIEQRLLWYRRLPHPKNHPSRGITQKTFHIKLPPLQLLTHAPIENPYTSLLVPERELKEKSSGTGSEERKSTWGSEHASAGGRTGTLGNSSVAARAGRSAGPAWGVRGGSVGGGAAALAAGGATAGEDGLGLSSEGLVVGEGAVRVGGRSVDYHGHAVLAVPALSAIEP